MQFSCTFALHAWFGGVTFFSPGLPGQQISSIILKELGDHPKIYIWDGEGNLCLFQFSVVN